MITANQYAVSKQSIQNKHIKINLLNFEYQTVAELSGNVLSGSISIDANSDIRRTCNIECVVTDSSFEVGEANYIWLDKYIQILIGIDNILTGEIEWFNQGIYLIDAPSYTYDAVTHTLAFTGLDLMAKLTGQRNGYLEGITTIIYQGANVREAIIQTISQLGGFTKYVVEECVLRDGTVQEVPYDIIIEQGGTIYDLLVQLRDIMPYYEIYFDVDGVFHYDKIPTGENEPVIADDDIFNNIIISADVNTDFSAVKNAIEVYGRDVEANYFATEVAVSNNIINLTIPDFESTGVAMDYLVFGFTIPSNIVAPIGLTINNDSLGTLIDYTSGDVLYVTNPTLLEQDKSYIVMMGAGQRGTLEWKLYPYEQFHALVEDTNPDSPFYINKPIGRIYQPLYGGEYDNIISNELCYERAKYELYLATNMQNDITLTCAPVYYFDVNQLVRRKFKDYIIKSINIGLGVDETMTITAIRYYPFYPSL